MRSLITISLAIAAFAMASSAVAAKRPEVLRTGKCSSGTTWKLKAKPEDSGIEAELEVDQNRVGRRWSVVLRRNGSVVFRGVRRTVAPSGSFEVRRILPGGGRIVASAKALSSGETCRASLSI